MKYYLFLLCFSLTSCLSTQTDFRQPIIPPNKPSDIQYQNISKEFTDNTSSMVNDAVVIKSASLRLSSMIAQSLKDEKIKEFLNQDVNLIINQSHNLQNNLNKSMEMNYRLDKMERYIEDLKQWGINEGKTREALEDRILDMEKTIEILTTKNKKSFFIIWFCMAGICALISLVGVYMVSQGNTKMGNSLIISGIVMACVSYFFVEYAWLVGIFGGVIVIGVLSYVYHHYIKKSDEADDNFYSLEELTQIIQDAKFDIPEFAILWDTKLKAYMEHKQSKLTKSVIKEIKGNS